MATVIDELVIKLGLDSSGFHRQASSTQAVVAQTGNVARRETRALEETVSKTQVATQTRMRQVEEVGRSATAGFSRLRHEVVGLLGAIAGAYGLQQFIRNVTASNAATGYLAQTIGISTKELSAWQEAAKRSGGTAEATGASMRTMAQEIQNYARSGQSSMVPELRRLQTMPGRPISLTDENNKARSITDIYKGLADRYSKMNFPAAVASGAALGIDEGTVRLLSLGNEGLEKRIAEMERLGVINQRDADTAIALQASWDSLQQAATRLGNTILTDLSPKIKAALDAMTEWVVANRAWLQLEIESKLHMLVTVVGEVATGIKTVVDFMGGWQTATELLFGLWLGSKFLGVIANLTKLISFLAVIPGSGIGASTLAALGIAFALKGDTADQETVMKALHPDWDTLSTEEKTRRRDEYNNSPGVIGQWWNSVTSGESGSATPERKAAARDALANRLGISTAAASGLVSNANAESGIRGINESNPTVPGSRGGFGWMQHTGPRRLELEAYAKRNNLDVSSDAANIGFIEEELRTRYPNVLAQLKRGDITATEAANIVFSDYVSGRAPELQRHRGGHTAGAEAISKLPSSTMRIPKTGPTFGPQMAPTSAIDPGMRFALRSPASAVDNSRSNTSSSETHVGSIIVNTAATDAEGISKGIGGALKKYAFVSQSNYGLA